jgi:hypothetical protein
LGLAASCSRRCRRSPAGLPKSATASAQTPLSVSLYSLKVDPYDGTHLVSGLHEADGIVESIDGGASWQMLGGAGFPTGGISWYPYFIDTGSAATTRKAWFAIAQDGASGVAASRGSTAA